MKKSKKTTSSKNLPLIWSIMFVLVISAITLLIFRANFSPQSADPKAAKPSANSCENAGGTCMSARNCQMQSGKVIGRKSCTSTEICCSFGTTTTPSTTITITPAQSMDKRVFFTSTHYHANLGGLVGADSKCQARADAAGLGGRWVAWLSDSKTDAKDRVTQTQGDYKLLDGTVLANGWADLTDGNLFSSIDVDENGIKRGNQSSIWTATNLRGEKNHTVEPSNFCSDFTMSDDSNIWPGNNFFADVGWTAHTYDYRCNGYYPLYCFEK